MKISDEMVEAAKEAYRKPRYMIPNTSEGSLTTRIYSALESALAVAPEPDAATEQARQAEAELRDMLRVDIPSLKDERDDALEAIERVREIHFERGHRPLDGTYLGGTACDGCRRPYPCPTVAALDGVPEVKP